MKSEKQKRDAQNGMTKQKGEQKPLLLPNNNLLPPSLSSLPLIISSTTSTVRENPIPEESSLNTRIDREYVTEVESLEELESAQIPTFFSSPNTLHIPNKVEVLLRRNLNTKLKEIHPDIEVAKELCLIFIANLSNTFLLARNATSDPIKQGWKRLHSNLLRQQVSPNWDPTYRKIIDLFLVGTKRHGAVIECDNEKVIGSKAYSYRLTERYFGKGVMTYELRTEYALRLRRKSYYQAIAKANNNVIAKNLINLYGHIDLPTEGQIIARATELIKEGYKRKGKKLTFLNKRSKDKIDTTKYSIVEDCIAIFKHLTQDGYMIPSPSYQKAGGRVVDSFTLMPSWIRAMCTIDGLPIMECDYKCLHPNTIMAIYGGDSKFLTHEQIAQALKVKKDQVKIEHLSFFNKHPKQMEKSILFKYYVNSEPEMMERLLDDKLTNKHKITTRKLFTLEVDIMTEVIKRLNQMDIYVGYIYDALFCTPKDHQTVKEIMELVIIEFGVYTTV